MGLRLVKLTVNQDDHTVYHFYYGDELGRPEGCFIYAITDRLTWLSLAYILYKLSLITTKSKNKRKMQYARESKISKKWLVIIIAVIGVVITLGVTFGVRSLVPVNGNSPVLLPAENIFIKAHILWRMVTNI